MHTKFLTEKERIEILILRGCDDKKRTYEQVVRQFNDTHPDRLPICKSTVCKTVSRFQDTGSVKGMLECPVLSLNFESTFLITVFMD